MNNFTKFAYGVRALAVSALITTTVVVELKEMGAFEYINEKVDNVKQNLKAKKVLH